MVSRGWHIGGLAERLQHVGNLVLAEGLLGVPDLAIVNVEALGLAKRSLEQTAIGWVEVLEVEFVQATCVASVFILKWNIKCIDLWNCFESMVGSF